MITQFTSINHRQCRISNRYKQRVRIVTYAGFGDVVKSFFNFEEWAPKSSRYWRLRKVPWEDGQYQTDDSENEQDEEFERQVQQLEQRIAKISQEEKQKRQQQQQGELEDVSFSEASDDELTSSLNERISNLGSVDQLESSEGDLTGIEFRQLIKSKYGKSYDISIARRDIPGKTLVSLNIMWLYLEQQSFQMSPEQYLEKLEGIAYYLNAWGQQDTVRAALREPMKSKRGLPKKPLPGIAVSIQLDLDQSIIDEYFGNKW
eukprot:TRINITY_DN2572_c0_g1_i4.p1 TRINITY_DN2572_c0_g1~~TRINITY_DN2572_c0_g1_i4.p1  ORF type:complete len:261 (+),score=27.97 TRINITY_DN2572_c0_g1_i4:113-895(+)